MVDGQTSTLEGAEGLSSDKGSLALRGAARPTRCLKMRPPPAEQVRQLRKVDRDPPRLVFAGQPPPVNALLILRGVDTARELKQVE